MGRRRRRARPTGALTGPRLECGRCGRLVGYLEPYERWALGAPLEQPDLPPAVVVVPHARGSAGPPGVEVRATNQLLVGGDRRGVSVQLWNPDELEDWGPVGARGLNIDCRCGAHFSLSSKSAGEAVNRARRLGLNRLVLGSDLG